MAEDEVEFKLSEDEAKLLVERNVADTRLLETIEDQMEKALSLLRGICMAISSCYGFDERHVKIYKPFKMGVFPQVVIFTARLLPITVLILGRMSLLFDPYFEKSFDLFQKTMLDMAKVWLEHGNLAKCLELWYANLEKELSEWNNLANEVLEATPLYMDVNRIKTDTHVLRVNSKIVEGIQNSFVPLLFIPRINLMAAPFVHGGAQGLFKPPVPARTSEEHAVAATLAMVGTMLPCLGQFTKLMRDLSKSLLLMENRVRELQAMGEVAVPQEEDLQDADQAAQAEGQSKAYKSRRSRKLEEEAKAAEIRAAQIRVEEVAMVFKRSHYDIVRNKSPRIQAKSTDIKQQNSILLADIEEVPFDREKIAEAWLEESVDSEGVSIKDHIADATESIEVVRTVD